MWYICNISPEYVFELTYSICGDWIQHYLFLNWNAFKPSVNPSKQVKNKYLISDSDFLLKWRHQDKLWQTSFAAGCKPNCFLPKMHLIHTQRIRNEYFIDHLFDNRSLYNIQCYCSPPVSFKPVRVTGRPSCIIICSKLISSCDYRG